MSSARVARLLGLGLSMLPLLVALTPARADDAAEARFFDGIGRRAYARGRWEEALSAFLAAEAAAPSPRTLYNVALAAQLAHEDGLAYASLESYLARAADDDPQRRTDARTRRDALAARLALVQVSSDPTGAEIWVDRRALGSFGRTPRVLVLDPGPHTIELTAPDHDPVAFEVVAARAHREDRAATLTPHLGSVHVEGTPSDATLVLRGSGGDRDVVMGVDLLVPVGAWTLTASAPGHVSRSFDLTVTRDAVERRSIALARIPAPTGRLLVSTGEVVARLSIDGAPRAETPARIDGVEVGRHTISIEAPGFVTWEGELEVSADRPAHISVTLVPR